MAQRLHIPRTVNRLRVGECSVYTNGRATFVVRDIEAAGINGRAVLLFDRDARTITMEPRGKNDGRPSVAVKRSVTGTTAEVYLGGAIRDMGIDPAKIAGRYGVSVGGGVVVELNAQGQQ